MHVGSWTDQLALQLRIGWRADHPDRLAGPRPGAVHRGIGMVNEHLGDEGWRIKMGHADADTDVAKAIVFR